jgi:uncharacterized membrane protein
MVARAFHVLAVVIWIGGVAMVTTVVLPALRRGDFGQDGLRAFQAVENRFVWIARAAVVIVGATGFYMVAQNDLWDRFRSAEFWWMHAMVGLWLLFAVILFVPEPLALHRRFESRAEPARAFARLQRAHWVLLGLSLVTIFGAVAGSHGWTIW